MRRLLVSRFERLFEQLEKRRLLEARVAAHAQLPQALLHLGHRHLVRVLLVVLVLVLVLVLLVLVPVLARFCGAIVPCPHTRRQRLCGRRSLRSLRRRPVVPELDADARDALTGGQRKEVAPDHPPLPRVGLKGEYDVIAG